MNTEKIVSMFRGLTAGYRMPADEAVVRVVRRALEEQRGEASGETTGIEKHLDTVYAGGPKACEALQKALAEQREEIAQEIAQEIEALATWPSRLVKPALAATVARNFGQPQ